MRVSVRVKPGASRTKVGGQYGEVSAGQGPVLIVFVAQRAVDGPLRDKDDEDRALTSRHLPVLSPDLGPGGSWLDAHAHSHRAIVSRVMVSHRGSRLRTGPRTVTGWQMC